MNKYKIIFILLVWGAPLFSEERKRLVATESPLITYSAGFAGGAFTAMNDELREKSDNFLKLSFANNIALSDQLNFFMDLNYFGPGNNYGGDVGMDFILPTGRFQPFLGMGVGFHHFDKKGTFGENIGVSGTIHLGFLVRLTDMVTLRVRAPFHFVANVDRDYLAGIDIGFLFSDRLWKTKKLTYDYR